MTNFATFAHKGILINISKTFGTRPSIYDCVRFAWRLDKNRASDYPLVFAMANSYIVGIFEVEKWLDATPENFPEYADKFAKYANDDTLIGRIGFVGKESTNIELYKAYINKEVPSEYRGQSVCRYIDPAKGENERAGE